MDSTAIALQRLADSLQIALLERSVQGATLTATWVGVAVGVLGVLFAAIAIATAIVLYRQTREFHARAERMVASYRGIVDKLVEEGRVMASAALDGIRAEAADVTKQLEQLGSEHRERRLELEQRQRELEQRRQELAAAVDIRESGPWIVKEEYSRPLEVAQEILRQNRQRRGAIQQCTNCGWRQSALQDPRSSPEGFENCPMCFKKLS